MGNPIKKENVQVAPKQRFGFWAFLFKLLLFAVFCYGAYMLLDRLGIIQNVREGFLLLQNT